MANLVRRRSRWLVAAGLSLLASCSSDSVSPTVTGLGSIVAWGSTTMVFNGSSAFRALSGDSRGDTDDYILVRNILRHLAGKTSNIRVLYTSTCDPRTDPNQCQVAPMEFLKPFYDMIASIGTITYDNISATALANYDAVIADFCSLPVDGYTVLRSYLVNGGKAMILADNFCLPDGTSTSAMLANAVVTDLGVTFSPDEILDRNRLAIPDSAQKGLLAGVSNLNVWRIAPQVLTEEFLPIVTYTAGSNRYVLHAIQKQP